MKTNMQQPKPIGSTWTDDQWSAISINGRDMLVAAAAGSGKTAVLVERIIRRISSEQSPIDVDRLLVATFTKAAADEMRGRIREALEQALAKQPHSGHLRKQLALLNRASITTLHSFCLEAVRRYFHRIELDPSFRIANETEAELLRQDVLEDMLERYYGECGEGHPFWQAVEWFSGDRSDSALYRLLQRLYDYSQSHPFPEQWLRRMASSFREGEESEEGKGQEEIWFQSLRQDVLLELDGTAALLTQALDIARMPGGPEPYCAALAEEHTLVSKLRDIVLEQEWPVLYEAFRAAGFAKLKPCKGDEIDKELQEQAKELRDQAKKKLSSLKEELFTRSQEQFKNELRQMAPVVDALVDLVVDFAKRYAAEKRSKKLVDFSDLEHYCLAILRDSNALPGQLVPSEAAMEYRSQFEEVLLDEYQDTNMVQESIVALISRPAPGNRFMVGDVKQSIYRFRLAEPALFLSKYRKYSLRAEDEGEGLRIDLAQNFRSRREVVDGVNFIFRQTMQERVAEIAYDERAELVCGASYPYPAGQTAEDYAVECLLIDRSEPAEDDRGSGFEQGSSSASDAETGADQGETESGSPGASAAEEAKDMETAQLEARLIAGRIHELLGRNGYGGDRPFLVFDKKMKDFRPVTYRDIVILLRATATWAPVLMEELKQAGIPAYAELNTGYFSATEVQMMMSLLQVIDNPYQDIPLAGVLRSPIYGLDAEQLAAIRISAKSSSYYDALLACVQAGKNEELTDKLRQFLEQLERWRAAARQGSLAELIWSVYRETGLYDFAGGMPGGVQRQANLRALYDRAKQYEATSFRGLFRFLRFIERMQESGGDLGTARALGEQEDVVRIMSIHKSKGLEFPVVFVAGLAKTFNRLDLRDSFLIHKELGFGPKFVDTQLRVSYPTLPTLAIGKRLRRESLAEELRILYVALTRPKEKLILVGTVKKLEKQLERWSRRTAQEESAMPDYAVAGADCYLDWIIPSVLRHPAGEQLLRFGSNTGSKPGIPPWGLSDPSLWYIGVIGQDTVQAFAEAAAATAGSTDKKSALRHMLEVKGVRSPYQKEIHNRLNWTYPYAAAEKYFAKTSITEIKRMVEAQLLGASNGDDGYGEGGDAYRLLPDAGRTGSSRRSFLRRPKFMQEIQVSPTERGTLYHHVMQHIPLSGPVSEQTVSETICMMREKQLIADAHVKVIDPAVIAAFFASELGQRMLSSKEVLRELPFSYGVPAGEVYPAVEPSVFDEPVLIQGVVDCLFADGDGYVLVDYKTDAVIGRPEKYREKYRIQMELYARAIGAIWKRPVVGKYLYLFDGMHVLEV